MPKILKIEPSPLKMKRYRITLQDGTKFDFGLKGGKTYIDGESELTRKNYLKRHLGNEIEKKLIENNIPSASLFSAKILWGESRSIEENIQKLNKLI